MIQTSQTALANGRSKIEDGLLLMVRGFAVTTPELERTVSLPTGEAS